MHCAAGNPRTVSDDTLHGTAMNGHLQAFITMSAMCVHQVPKTSLTPKKQKS